MTLSHRPLLRWVGAWMAWIVGMGTLSAEDALNFDDPAAAELVLVELVDQWQTAWQQQPNAENAIGYGESLHGLGVIQRQMGQKDEALASLQQAAELLAAAPAEQLADVQEALALSLQDAGRLDEAGQVLEELVSYRREMAQVLELAHSLDHLAMNHLVAGQYDHVLPLLKEALELLPESAVTDRAHFLGHLGRYYHTLGSHARSTKTLREALDLPFENHELRLTLMSQLALCKLRLGEIEATSDELHQIADDAIQLFADRPALSTPFINNIGDLFLYFGNPREAAEEFRASVAILEAELGPEDPSLMTPLNNLGVALIRCGEDAEARIALERCLALQRRHLDSVHLRVAETQRNLAFAYLHLDRPQALKLVDETSTNALKLLDKVIAQGSEQERLNFLSRFDPVSLPCATGDPQRIAKVLIETKGRLLDTLLAEISSELPSVEEIKEQLPPNSAFVDVCRYLPDDLTSTPRYGCILYLPDQALRWIPLGEEAAAVRWLEALRTRLRWKGGQLSGEDAPPPTLKLKTILAKLDEEFWQPIAEALPAGTQHIAWSPDGALHFLPLAALLDQAEIPLCHRYLQVTTVAHARDMAEPPPERKLNAGPWEVVTVSDFPRPTTSTSPQSPLLQLLSSLERMPGTTQESRYLHRLAPPDSTFLHNRESTEENLRRSLESPTVLHLGCHAFFLADSFENAGVSLDFDVHSDLLYAGGLVLYRGATRPFAGPPVLPDDDILFPGEISKLSLQDTRLVTLSSCDSGSGTPVSGEGILGLRRSFHLAGAREVAVALWPVSDATTPRFMRSFYQRALASDRPGQALWETQRDHIPVASDPDFELAVLRYAPFTLSQAGPLLTGPAISKQVPNRSLSYHGVTAGLIFLFIIAILLALKRMIFNH